MCHELYVCRTNRLCERVLIDWCVGIRKTYLQFRCPCHRACREHPLLQHFQMSLEHMGNLPGLLLRNRPHRPPSAKTHANTFSASAQVLSRKCSCRAVPLCPTCFSAVGEKLWPRVSENEWAQRKGSSCIQTGGFNHQCDCLLNVWQCLRFFWLFVIYQHCCFIPQDSLPATKKCRNKKLWPFDIIILYCNVRIEM